MKVFCIWYANFLTDGFFVFLNLFKFVWVDFFEMSDWVILRPILESTFALEQYLKLQGKWGVVICDFTFSTNASMAANNSASLS